MLLAAFFLIERRARQPITPLQMFADRNRAGTYVIMLRLAAAMFGMFFFLTLFVQNVLGYSPLRAGLAFLPVSAGSSSSAPARLPAAAGYRAQAVHGRPARCSPPPAWPG